MLWRILVLLALARLVTPLDRSIERIKFHDEVMSSATFLSVQAGLMSWVNAATVEDSAAVLSAVHAALAALPEEKRRDSGLEPLDLISSGFQPLTLREAAPLPPPLPPLPPLPPSTEPTPPPVELTPHPEETLVMNEFYEALGRPSWSNWGTNVSMCEWRGVSCDEWGGHKHVLSVTLEWGMNQTGTLPTTIGRLLGLESLNIFPPAQMSGTLPSALFGLEYFSYIWFVNQPKLSGTIPTAFATSTIGSCVIQGCGISGSIPGVPPTLREGFFVLDRNKLTGTLPELDLAYDWTLLHPSFAQNQLCGTIPASWRAISSVELKDNRITGLHPDLAFWPVQNLNLANNLIRSVPPGLCNTSTRVAARINMRDNLLTEFPTPAPQLWTLQLQNNQLTSVDLGPSSILGYVDLSWNLLTHLACENCTRLRELRAPNNYLTEIDLACPELKVLDVSSNNIATFSPRFSLMTSLETLQFSFNWVTHLPPTEAKLSTIIGNANGLRALPTITTCADNAVTGTLPNLAFDRLTHLSVQRNALSGTLPLGLFSDNLEHLDLSYNQFAGTLPKQVGGCLGLRTVELTSNFLCGTIPLQIGATYITLNNLKLGANTFSGTIPATLSDCIFLQTLELSNNGLSGTLHTSLGNIASLTHLELNNNRLSGTIPNNLHPSAILVINLSRNRLSGTLPSAFGLARQLITLNVDENLLSGSLPESLFNLGALAEVYTATNRLSGSLPPTILNAKALTRINIDGNPLLSGSVPDSFWALPRLVEFRAVGTDMRGNPPNTSVTGTASLVTIRPGSLLPALCRSPQWTDGRILDTSPAFSSFGHCRCMDGGFGNYGVCVPCPFGADCQDGQLLLRRGFWLSQAALEGAIVDAQPCPTSYCCPDGGCTIANMCAEGRTGTLCGSCLPDYSETTGSTQCVPNAECNPSLAAGLIFIVVVACGAFVLVVTARFTPLDLTQPATGSVLCSQAVSALIFFYQVAPLVSETLTRRVVSVALETFVNIFNMQLPTGVSRSGLCLFPNVDAIKGMLVSYIFPLALFSWVLVTALGVRVYHRIRGLTVPTNLREGSVKAMLVVCGFAYSSVLKSTFNLLRCVNVSVDDDDNPLVMFLAGDTTCYQLWQKVLFIAVPPLAFYPVGLFIWIRHKKAKHCLHGTAIYSTLLYPFHGEWFGPALLFFRLAFVSVFCFVRAKRAQSWTLFVMSMCVFTLTLIKRPIRNPVIQTWYVTLFFLLCCSAGFGVAARVYDAFGLVDDEQDLRRLATATAVIQTVPVAIISTVAVLTLIWSRLPLRARSIIIWVSIRVPIFGHSLTHIVNRDIFASVSRGSSHRDLFAQVDRALATPHGSSHSHANGSAHGSLGNGSHRSPKSHGHGHAGVQGEGIKLATFPAPPDEPCCWLCGGCENLVDEGTRYRCADECIALA